MRDTNAFLPFLALLLQTPATPLPASVDAAEDARAADRAFSAAVEARDTAAFRALVAPDALFLGAGVHEGPDAVARAWAPFFDPASGTTVSWAPTEARAAASGELACTLGRAVFRVRAGAETREHEDRYVSVWRKDDAHGWRVIADGSVLAPALDRRSALARLWSPLAPLEAAVTIDTTPTRVVRAGSDDLALCLGDFALEARGESGSASAHGRYFAVYTRADDGLWTLFAESFSPPRP